MGGTSNFLEMLKTSMASFLTGSFPWKTLLPFVIPIFIKTTKILISPTVKIFWGVLYFYLKATHG